MSLLKPLLTKKERESLNARERKKLRNKRRKDRKTERHGPPFKLNMAALKARAGGLIHDLAEDAIPGREKMDEVLDSLAEDADSFLVWQWAGPVGVLFEMADGPALKALVRVFIRPHVQRMYDELADRGIVPSKRGKRG